MESPDPFKIGTRERGFLTFLRPIILAGVVMAGMRRRVLRDHTYKTRRDRYIPGLATSHIVGKPTVTKFCGYGIKNLLSSFRRAQRLTSEKNVLRGGLPR